MARRILVINGHPDARPERFCVALADAYADGAASAHHEVQRINVGMLDFPLLRTSQEFASPPTEPCIAVAQEKMRWAHHLVFIHPLWLGAAPALLKGFMEQIARNEFAISASDSGFPKRHLSARSAHLIVTMGMPSFAYRLLFGAFGTRSFERSILRISGVKPVRHTYLGAIEGSQGRRERWLDLMRELGADAR
jgi:putative NADPH-quinone reductase